MSISYQQTWNRTVSRKLFGIGHMYIYSFVLRMTDTVAYQNIDLSFWDILYIGTSVLSTLSHISDAWLARRSWEPTENLFNRALNFLNP
jgi:hypothetical protein